MVLVDEVETVVDDAVEPRELIKGTEVGIEAMELPVDCTVDIAEPIVGVIEFIVAGMLLLVMPHVPKAELQFCGPQ